MDSPLLTFPPDTRCPASNVSSHGGAIATGAPVHLLFWGQDWQTRPGPGGVGLLADAVTAAVKSILAGPWMSGLRQYGVKRSAFGSSTTVATDPPFLPHTFDNGDVENLIQSRIDGGQFPEPDEPGGRNLYVVFMPPNTKHPDIDGIQPAGAHSSFNTGSIIDVDRAWYAFVCTNSFGETIRAFSHELAEMCTDPESDGWKVDGGKTGCDEIGDLCNSRVGTVSGVDNVEAYWSNVERICIIPVVWSVRHVLGWAGKRLDGHGLRSLQNPVPSLKQFIVNV